MTYTAVLPQAGHDGCDLHRLKVLVSENEAVGVAELPEDFPRSLMPASLYEELVEEEEP